MSTRGASAKTITRRSISKIGIKHKSITRISRLRSILNYVGLNKFNEIEFPRLVSFKISFKTFYSGPVWVCKFKIEFGSTVKSGIHNITNLLSYYMRRRGLAAILLFEIV